MTSDLFQRRHILAALAAGAASTVLPVAALAADAPYKPRRIDVHHHVPPPAYVEWTKAGNATYKSPLDVEALNIDERLADMERHGIETAIVSSPDLNGRLPGDFGDVVRSCNEWMAQIARDRPKKFGSFSMMPLPNVDLTLAEITYGLDTLHADGVRFAPSYDGKYLGHADFAPVLAELNRRKAVAFVHPTQPQCCSQILPDLGSATVEFPFDTMRSIADLLFTGSLAKYPDIKWIFSHGGGTLPMLAWRISNSFEHNKRMAGRAPNGPLYELKKIYVDIAGAFYPSAAAGVAALSGPNHILFGTDVPYTQISVVDQGIKGLHWPVKLLRALNRENALPLFPRLQKA